jgi:hypothetical protein
MGEAETVGKEVAVDKAFLRNPLASYPCPALCQGQMWMLPHQLLGPFCVSSLSGPS